jgi:hypothetical protein
VSPPNKPMYWTRNPQLTDREASLEEYLRWIPDVRPGKSLAPRAVIAGDRQFVLAISWAIAMWSISCMHFESSSRRFRL